MISSVVEYRVSCRKGCWIAHRFLYNEPAIRRNVVGKEAIMLIFHWGQQSARSGGQLDERLENRTKKRCALYADVIRHTQRPMLMFLANK